MDWRYVGCYNASHARSATLTSANAPLSDYSFTSKAYPNTWTRDSCAQYCWSAAPAGSSVYTNNRYMALTSSALQASRCYCGIAPQTEKIDPVNCWGLLNTPQHRICYNSKNSTSCGSKPSFSNRRHYFACTAWAWASAFGCTVHFTDTHFRRWCSNCVCTSRSCRHLHKQYKYS